MGATDGWKPLHLIDFNPEKQFNLAEIQKKTKLSF
jgi:hypothetical protein